MKTAVISGSTGLVGQILLYKLLESNYYEKVISLVRRPSLIKHHKLTEIIIDFDELLQKVQPMHADDAYCCLGTTIKKAGSKSNQEKIDRQYVTNFANLVLKNGVSNIAIVSSIGANKSSSNFYLHTKGQMEEDIKQLPFNNISFIRPSFILGDRKEFRLGEKIGIFVFKIFDVLLLGKLRIYKGIQASKIASGMIGALNSGIRGINIYHYDDILRLNKGV